MLGKDDVKRSLLCFTRLMATFHESVFDGYWLPAIALTYLVAFQLSTHIPVAHQIPRWIRCDSDPWHSLRSYVLHVQHTYLTPRPQHVPLRPLCGFSSAGAAWEPRS